MTNFYPAAEFDADAFMETTLDAPLSTEQVLVPVGKYPATLNKIWEPRKVTFEQDGQMVSKVALDLSWAINDKNVWDVVGQAHPFVRQTVWINLDSEGRIDVAKGKNRQLAKLMQATGREAGRPLKTMEGSEAYVTVAHKPDRRKNEVTGQWEPSLEMKAVIVAVDADES
jgi:hypothetical protein